MLSLAFRFSIGAICAARPMVSLCMAHQVRFELECFRADCASKWSVFRMRHHMVTVQIAIGEFTLAHFARVHFLFRMFVIDVLIERVYS